MNVAILGDRQIEYHLFNFYAPVSIGRGHVVFAFSNSFFVFLWHFEALTHSHTTTPFDAPGKQAF